MRILKHSERKTEVTFHLSFYFVDEPCWGFSFDCDESGNLKKLGNPAAEANYAACLLGEKDGKKILPKGVERREHSWREPAVGKCDCGRRVYLDSFTNTCDCGRDYNMSGQLLAPREQWGEETGERWYECY